MSEQKKFEIDDPEFRDALIRNWDQVRMAYHVARLGTLSAAADFLDVHHATVIRHIDALEEQLGIKLFQRHPRGYAPTEAGQDLLAVAATAEDMFAQFAGRAKGRGNSVSGELVISTVANTSPLLTKVFADFHVLHPDIRFRLITEERRARLEQGEAHIALRAGPAPQEPDNVAQKLADMSVGLFAHPDYIARKGLPQTESDFEGHEFIGPIQLGVRAPFNRWLAELVPETAFVFRCNEMQGIMQAIKLGMGIGFVSRTDAASDRDLVEVLPPKPEWSVTMWLVTHVDMHRTVKVQEFSRFLKQRAKDWPV